MSQCLSDKSLNQTLMCIYELLITRCGIRMNFEVVLSSWEHTFYGLTDATCQYADFIIYFGIILPILPKLVQFSSKSSYIFMFTNVNQFLGINASVFALLS